MPRAKKQQDPDESIEVVSEEQRVRKSPRRKNPTEKMTKPVKKETKKPGPKKRGPKKASKDQYGLPQLSPSKEIPSPIEFPKVMSRVPSLNHPSSASSTPAPPRQKITEQDIIAATSSHDIVGYLNTLVGSEAEANLNEYRRTTKLQMDNDASLIRQLRTELQQKQESIDTLLKQVSQLQNNGSALPATANATPQKRVTGELYKSPIRSNSASTSMISSDDLAQEMKTIGVTLDMLELLTGVRIVNYEEDKEKFHFDVKQSSTNSEDDSSTITVEYKLVIKKQFELSADVNYIPTFLKKVPSSVKNRLIENLPDYLQGSLVFPYNTLSQFYAKMNRALNKSTKS
ncbi:hypothetical_protein [Candidozyma auris]|uniref:hypothetical_protein n=1 Tax=Candidozyma auris TaxID=498019 RepID=UPI000D2AAF72|nr:hypothetical_protein [[Candida] auris]QEO22245.1 hypothetical_protein [[Candida] auris]GBL51345.1 hypothetical protein CAJCM15448_36190 [[Candida] auris]